jgi:hypothetical protein
VSADVGTLELSNTPPLYVAPQVISPTYLNRGFSLAASPQNDRERAPMLERSNKFQHLQANGRDHR